MKKIILGLSLLLCLCNCFAQGEATQEYLDKYVVMSSVKAREISSTGYVVEIKLKDYENTSSLPQGFGLNDELFGDDGLGYDLESGDGVYTSKGNFIFKTDDRTNLERNEVYYDNGFERLDELNNDETLTLKVKISCKIGRTGCPPPTGGTCTACVQMGWSCWGITECEVSFEW